MKKSHAVIAATVVAAGGVGSVGVGAAPASASRAYYSCTPNVPMGVTYNNANTTTIYNPSTNCDIQGWISCFGQAGLHYSGWLKYNQTFQYTCSSGAQGQGMSDSRPK